MIELEGRLVAKLVFVGLLHNVLKGELLPEFKRSHNNRLCRGNNKNSPINFSKMQNKLKIITGVQVSN